MMRASKSDTLQKEAKGVHMFQTDYRSDSVPSMVSRRVLAAMVAMAIAGAPVKTLAATTNGVEAMALSIIDAPAKALATATATKTPKKTPKKTPLLDGVEAFRDGKVEESLQDYARFLQEKPGQKPELWMRGVSLYYANRFNEGADQFAITWTKNPNDENRLWHLLCLARTEGLDAARKKRLPYGREARPVLRAAFGLFAGDTDEAALQKFTSSGEGYVSYIAYFYLGMYREALGDESGARKYIASARNTFYGQWTENYMTDLARVHVKLRGW